MSQYYRSITGNRIVPSTIYERTMIFFVGLFGSLTMLTSFASVKFIPVSDATTLIFTVPLFTMILAAVFLKERLTMSNRGQKSFYHFLYPARFLYLICG